MWTGKVTGKGFRECFEEIVEYFDSVEQFMGYAYYYCIRGRLVVLGLWFVK
jgi:hypothetical protein